VLFLAPPLATVGLVAAALLAGLVEFYRLLEARGLAPFRKTGALLAALIFVEETAIGRSGPPAWPLVALLVLTATLRRAGDLALTVPSAAATLLGAVYLGALGGALAALRLLPPVDAGAWRILLLLGAVMAADTFAYFAGHLTGRHRLAPAISPAKTVEGFAGGLVGGVLGALLVRAVGMPGLPLASTVALGVLVAALGTVGDLLESLLKRWAGVKDSGGLFPGHGGMLDRLDSLLFGAPVLYYYLVYAY
jgi:phosphatidate cytidylyltransferase